MKSPLSSFLLFPFVLLFLLLALSEVREPTDSTKPEPMAARLDPAELARPAEKLPVKPVRSPATAPILPPSR